MKGQSSSQIQTAEQVAANVSEPYDFGMGVGFGHFGSVRPALCDGMHVAVKSLHGSCGADTSERGKRALEKEARILENKRHPNIVGFHSYVRTSNFLITELCKQSLHNALYDPLQHRRVKNLNLRLLWLEEIASAMIVMHFKEPIIVHRDLKPENIFLDAHDAIRVGDFGLAQIVGVPDGDSTQNCDERYLLLLYQSPEVINSPPEANRYSTKSDVWSFGVILQELITMARPYELTDLEPDNVRAVVYHVGEDNTRPTLPTNRCRIPGKWHPCLERLAGLMNRCCERNPDARPTAKEIYGTIRNIREQYERIYPMEKSQLDCSCFHITSSAVILISFVVVLGIRVERTWKEVVEEEESLRYEQIIVITTSLVFIVWIILVASNYHTCCWSLPTSFCNTSEADMVSETWGCTSSRTSQRRELSQMNRQQSQFEDTQRHHEHGASSIRKTEIELSLRNWSKFRQSVLNEMSPDSPCPHAQYILSYCKSHLNDPSSDRDEWRAFVARANQCAEFRETSVWQNYQPLFHSTNDPEQQIAHIGCFSALQTDPSEAGPSQSVHFEIGKDENV